MTIRACRRNWANVSQQGYHARTDCRCATAPVVTYRTNSELISNFTSFVSMLMRTRPTAAEPGAKLPLLRLTLALPACSTYPTARSFSTWTALPNNELTDLSPAVFPRLNQYTVHHLPLDSCLLFYSLKRSLPSIVHC